MRLITLLCCFVHLFLQNTWTIQSSNYTCRETDVNLQFTIVQTNHSAWQPATSCARSLCDIISNDESSCRSYSAPCFAYQSLNFGRMCAPAFLCSVLEPCNQVNFSCSSNSSICVINSCCSPQAVCLPSTSIKYCVSPNSTVYSGSM